MGEVSVSHSSSARAKICFNDFTAIWTYRTCYSFLKCRDASSGSAIAIFSTNATVDSKTDSARSSTFFISSYAYAIYLDKQATDFCSATCPASCSPHKQSCAWLGCFRSNSSFFIYVHTILLSATR